MNERNPWMRLAVDNDQRWRDCSAERYELKRRLENAAAVCRYLRGEVERLAEERHPLTTPIYIAKCYTCGNKVHFQILEDSQGPNNE